jgi:leucyl-tRNA synthetase
MSTKSYNHTSIEKKWQKEWEANKTYVPNVNSAKKPFYNLWMFPYPSAEGVHVGTIFSSTGSDIYGRYKRMNGYDVFQPFGYDSFGIHSENYAIKIGETPQVMLERTIAHYESQFKMAGHGYDWTRTLATSNIDYYKWTQWLFIEMFKAGLAYRKKASVNWCPGCKTVLADEQIQTPLQAGKIPPGFSSIEEVPEGTKVCERCGNIPDIKELEQWFFGITKYADKLLEGQSSIDWSERVSIAQRNWIGKKEGVLIDQTTVDDNLTLTSFSAYPAWLFADTFLVISPEHPLVADLVRGSAYEKDALAFVEDFKNSKKNKNRVQDEKAGIFTGKFVTDPFSGNKMPVWIANFALMDFGTGIIRCSAHDPRDYEFAKKYKIPLKEVVTRTDPKEPVNAHTNEGVLIDSGPFTGNNINQETIKSMVDWIEEQKIGKRTTTYHLRDWLISRQRYWGPPIPMIHCADCERNKKSWFDTEEAALQKKANKILDLEYANENAYGWYPVPDSDLPVPLPVIEDYRPEGEGRGPLDNHPEFYEVKCPGCGSQAKRETDVSDTFLDSAWYFLRYPSVDAENSTVIPFDSEITNRWLPVNLYFGGAEHAVLHLMYARFVTQVLFDLDYLSFDEPFPQFYAHGLMIKDGAKMSKSRGNVVNPDEYIAKFGADTLRFYLMFMGPMDGYPDFRDTGIEGMKRFTDRLWHIFLSETPALTQKQQEDVAIKMHQTIKKVTEDVEIFHYNTAISAIMEYANELRSHISNTKSQISNNIDKENNSVWRSAVETLAQLIAPFAPHMAEEVWINVFKHKSSIHLSVWPKFDTHMLKTSVVTFIIQVDGKVRATLPLEKDIANNKQKAIESAKLHPNLDKWLEDIKSESTVFVPGRLVNFVTK